MSVVFDFSASLNDVAPVSPMLFPVDFMKIEKSGLLMDVTCVLFLLSSPPRLSFVSVLFDFNASLNDVAPLSPILPSVGVIQPKTIWNYYFDHDVISCLTCQIDFFAWNDIHQKKNSLSRALDLDYYCIQHDSEYLVTLL